MVKHLEQLFGANWRTTVSGNVALAAGAIALNPWLIAFLPEKPREIVLGIATFIAFLSGGTFAAVCKDRQVTGGKVQQDLGVYPRPVGEAEDRIPGI